jgi:hypothetical protein
MFAAACSHRAFRIGRCGYSSQPTSPIISDVPCASANRWAALKICDGERHLYERL